MRLQLLPGIQGFHRPAEPMYPQNPLFGQHLEYAATGFTSQPRRVAGVSGILDGIAFPISSYSHPMPIFARQPHPGDIHNSNLHISSDSINTFGRPVDVMHSLRLTLPNMDYFDTGHTIAQSSLDVGRNEQMEPLPIAPTRIERTESHKRFVRSQQMDTLNRPRPGISLKDPPPSQDSPDKDILACLSKLTPQSIADDNPFEPVPLPEELDKPHGTTPTMDLSSTSYMFSRPEDDSSHQSFAEG
jgi:hypothetical protein